MRKKERERDRTRDLEIDRGFVANVVPSRYRSHNLAKRKMTRTMRVGGLEMLAREGDGGETSRNTLPWYPCFLVGCKLKAILLAPSKLAATEATGCK